MVYAAPLREIGNRFMRSSLGYEAEGGGGAATRGDYLAVHLRRRDYAHSRPGEFWRALLRWSLRLNLSCRRYPIA